MSFLTQKNLTCYARPAHSMLACFATKKKKLPRARTHTEAARTCSEIRSARAKDMGEPPNTRRAGRGVQAIQNIGFGGFWL